MSFATALAPSASRSTARARSYSCCSPSSRPDPIAARRASMKPRTRADCTHTVGQRSSALRGRNVATAARCCRAFATWTSKWCARARSSASCARFSASAQRANDTRYIAIELRVMTTARAELNARKITSASVACRSASSVFPARNSTKPLAPIAHAMLRFASTAS